MQNTYLSRDTAEDRVERSKGLGSEGRVHKFPVSLVCLSFGYTTSV